MKILFLIILFSPNIKGNTNVEKNQTNIIINECIDITTLLKQKDLEGLDFFLNSKYKLDYTNNELNELITKYSNILCKYGDINIESKDIKESYSQISGERRRESISIIFFFGQDNNEKIIFDYELFGEEWSLKSLTLFSISKEMLDKMFEGL